MRTTILLLFVTTIIATTMTGCERRYCCGYPENVYSCIKGSDSVLVYIVGTSGNIQSLTNDSLNVYTGNGYTCTQTPGSSLMSATGYLTCIPGTQKRKAATSGMNCVEGGDDGGCSCW